MARNSSDADGRYQIAEGRTAVSRMADFPGAVTRHLVVAIPDGRDLGPENEFVGLLPRAVLINPQLAKLIPQPGIRGIRD